MEFSNGVLQEWEHENHQIYPIYLKIMFWVEAQQPSLILDFKARQYYLKHSQIFEDLTSTRIFKCYSLPTQRLWPTGIE